MKNIYNFFTNFSLRIFGSFLSKLLSVITIPIIARALGPEKYGEYTLALTVLNYSFFLVNLGFPTFGLREIILGRNSQIIISEIISARLYLAVISVILNTIILLIIFEDISFILLIVIGYILIFAHALKIDFFFFSQKNFIIPLISQIFGQLVFVAGVFFFIRNESHIHLLIFFYSLYYFLYSIIGLAIYYNTNSKIVIRFSFIRTIELIKKTFKIGISSKLEMIQFSIPIFLIPIFFNEYYLGIFSSAIRILSLIIFAYQSILLILAPDIIKKYETYKKRVDKYIYKMLAITFFLGASVSILLYSFGEQIVLFLFGNSFIESLDIFYLICFLIIPFQPVYMFLLTSLVYLKYDNQYLIINIITTIIIVTLTPIFIHIFSLSGVIYALFCSSIISSFLIVLYLKKLAR